MLLLEKGGVCQGRCRIQDELMGIRAEDLRGVLLRSESASRIHSKSIPAILWIAGCHWVRLAQVGKSVMSHPCRMERNMDGARTL